MNVETYRNLMLLKYSSPIFEEQSALIPNKPVIPKKESWGGKMIEAIEKYGEDSEEYRIAKQKYEEVSNEFWLEEKEKWDFYDTVEGRKQQELIWDFIESGSCEFQEYLEFSRKPDLPELIEFLQEYLTTLLRISIEDSPDQYEPFCDYTGSHYKSSLVLDGVSYSSQKADDYITALLETLPTAENILIKTNYDGNLRKKYENQEDQFDLIRESVAWSGKTMLPILEGFMEKAPFLYKVSSFSMENFRHTCAKIENGLRIDISSVCDSTILEKELSGRWVPGGESDLIIRFCNSSFSAVQETYSKLHDLIRKTFGVGFFTQMRPEIIQTYEKIWETDSAVLFTNLFWLCTDLDEIQDFFNQLNKIVLPEKDHLSYVCGNSYWVNTKNYAYATWAWTEEGFKIVGTCL